ncbi:F-box protein SKIP23-like [Trifolium pratense]|uniref:F-box protein SKIP23-like n=1 Tax=Trifolium pratense TaxID=57577 RepID=UPI001E6939B4|nr:F-box protein SKIP23-like [Trifolium pratense]
MVHIATGSEFVLIACVFKVAKPYTDVCVFNGRLIAVDSTGRTVAVGPDLGLDLVAEAVFGGDTKILVESDGELLLVDKYLKPCMNGTVSFEGQGVYEVRMIESAARLVVFRLDEKEKKWVELTNLGDRVLFLGEECAFSLSASDLGMENGNCVIFIDHVHHIYRSTELGISVFCLDKCQISPLSDFPCCSKLFWPPPQWVGLC